MLFFDAEWFDARLKGLGLDRGALAEVAGLDRGELRRIFENERAATAEELRCFAGVLKHDLLEVTLRSGVAAREAGLGEDPIARIESIEARLDAMDNWLDEFERSIRLRA